MTNGNFDIDLAANGNDETAQLQSALNSMAATLRNNLAEITAKTEETEDKAIQAQEATRKAEEAMRQRVARPTLSTEWKKHPKWLKAAQSLLAKQD
ncbi:HAMP domain-containing protein [Maridesulfovibrio sp.]|uniref:HAMP domain-containing protein n=1 Tax=Maridesulfovibrio sp. TaxID=2795000 RepID=UPI0038B3B7CA